MEKIKRHAALPVLAAAIAIIVVLAATAYGAKDNGKLEIRDAAGNREALAGVTISGELGDGMHRMRFRVENGQVNADTELFDQPRSNYIYHFSAGGPVRLGDREYSIENRSDLHTITSWKMAKEGYRIPEGMAEVTPPAVRRESAGEGTASPNPVEYGLAIAGGQVYYTVPVTSDYTGSTSIYELRFYEWGFRPTNLENYAPRSLLDIPLKGAGAGEQGGGIDILGLEAVGDKLALLSVERNALHIRSYDRLSGELLGQISVPDFYLSDTENVSRPANAVLYSPRYEAYPDDKRQTLSLGFRRVSPAVEGTGVTALSFDFSQGVELVGQSALSFDDGEEDMYTRISYMGYKDGKLYALRSFREPEKEELRTGYNMMRAQQVMIYVYERSKLVYKGELVSDLNEDNIRAYNQSPPYGDLGDPQADYRHFANIVVE